MLKGRRGDSQGAGSNPIGAVVGTVPCSTTRGDATMSDEDVVLTGVSTAAERSRIAKESAIELLDGDASSQALRPQTSNFAGRRRQLSVAPPRCELLDSASPEAVLRALALADKLADTALVSLCETILAARISEISRCSAFAALAAKSPAEAARLMARAEAAASTSTTAGPRSCR